MPEKLIAPIATLLATYGWTPLEGSTAIASKTFATAVGPKVAHAYLADFGSVTENLMLQGDYRSEGRNILESNSVLIPRNAEETQLQALVGQFAARADHTVGESYAARLLR